MGKQHWMDLAVLICIVVAEQNLARVGLWLERDPH